MSKLATVLTFTSRVFVSVRHPVSARHLSFTFQRVPPQTPVTLRSADCGSWRPNRDPRSSDPCLYFYYLVFVLYCLFLVWLSSQERNGLTTGSCSPAYGEEVGYGEPLEMGVSGSKGQKLFVSVLQRLLSERGLHVKESSAIEFYQFLIKVSPWFPEEGGLNSQDWKRVGREMKRYAAEHGTDSIPKQAYPIWLQLREILTEQSDLVLLSAEAKSVTEEELEEGLTGLLSTSSQEKTYGTRGTAYAEIDTEVDKLSEHIYDEPYEEKEKADKHEEKDHVRKVKKVVQRKEISEGKRKEKDQKAFLATDWNDDDLSPED